MKNRNLLICIIMIFISLLTISCGMNRMKTSIVGNIIQFGGSDWQILDATGDRALIISVDITKRMPYNQTLANMTWYDSEIRRYLNRDYFNTFNVEDRARIIETVINNENNQWYGTPGGDNTSDHIFLLSIAEVVRYYGNSGRLANRPSWQMQIDDQFNENRQAQFTNRFMGWWLRSPGFDGHSAAIVNSNGNLAMSGIMVNATDVGVRPAMWVVLN